MSMQLDDYRLLGRSGLRVSPLCLGTMTFGTTPGWGTEQAEAKSMVDLFIERGGNFIDTANYYGDSEDWLKPMIADRREQLVLSTKYSLSMRAGDPNGAGNHRKNMVQSVESSLKRMGIDYIDLMFLHMWDFRTPVEEILRAFDDLVRAGKILYGALSDTPAWQVSRMQAIADLRGWTPFIGLQIPYNLTQRTVEREYMPMAREMGIGVLPWSPLAGGVLSGKYSKADLDEKPTEFGANSTRKDINKMTGRLSERNLTIADEARDIAQEIGVTPAQVALAWTLLNPAVTAPVLGARTLVQLEDNLGALAVELSDEHIRRLDEVSRIPLEFPADIWAGGAWERMFGGAKVAARVPAA
ncbi:aldo/keto reductase [Sphingobium sp. C100]|uniref:aldo/keto reductase n=1 Tax=Sphingobium sp. C100 TaxID=1207055 RepID=UPI0003D5B86C|nr:aldo/keto reductase [Sphingobium sp. C100]ETI64235.1 aldo/keto reductase [Sphingobium sp. C100]